MKLKCDLHIHSCLSPCGDEDMTPNNIVNMALLAGLNAIALTDHNACGNCAATMEVGAKNGLLVVPGMELTTAEDAHIVCLFPGLEEALAFEAYVRRHHMVVENNPKIFGEQTMLNALDEPVGRETRLLITASSIGSFQVARLCAGYGGVATPAHVDKEANSLVATLGFLTPDMGFVNVELSKNAPADYMDKRADLADMGAMRNSDAHFLWDIGSAWHEMDLNGQTAGAVVEGLRRRL